MKTHFLVQRIERAIDAVDEVGCRSVHSDNQIRVGSHFYSRAELKQLSDTLASLAHNLDDERR